MDISSDKKTKSEILMQKFAEDLENGRVYWGLCFDIGMHWDINISDIPDIIQEHYISTSKNFDRNYKKAFDESTDILDEDLRKYLTTGFYNKTKDYLRKQKTIKEKNENSLSPEDIRVLSKTSEEDNFSILEICIDRYNYDTNSPLNQVIKKEQIEIAKGCLGQLSKKYQDVLLGSINGLTYTQISKIFGIPISTVKSRLNYAKKALKKQWRIFYQ